MNLSEAYKILGVAEGSDKDTVKKAFRKKAAQFHPDQNKSPDAVEQFKLVNEANQLIETGKDFGPSQPQQHNYSSANNVSDFFSNFANPFGGGFQQQHIVLEDININATISFKESVIGTKKPIKYNRKIKCQDCNGQGRKQLDNGCSQCGGQGMVIKQVGNMIMQQTCPGCKGKVKTESCNKCGSKGTVLADTSVEVTIPPGVQNSNILRLGGVGNYSGNVFGQDQSSNVNLHISVIPQDKLSLIDNDVITNINISLLNALSGTTISVPTIDGDKDISIPRASKNKDEVILPNLGVNRRGNERVIISIDYPDDIEQLIEFLKN